MDTKKLTSRFRRHTDKASDAVLPGGNGTAVHPTGDLPEAVPAPAPSPAAPSPAPPSSEVERATAAAPALTAAKPGSVSPSRLVEGARSKTSETADKPAAKVRLAEVLRVARPAVPIAATIMLALGIGYGVGTSVRLTGPDNAASSSFVTAAADLRQSSQDIALLATELKSLRVSVEGLKGERDKTRGEILAKQAQLSEKLERSGQDQTVRISRLSDQIDRVEKSQRDSSRFQTVTEKLDRIERGLPAVPGSAPTPPPKPVASAAAAPDVAHTGSIPEARPLVKTEFDPRKIQVEGYFVRDVDDGYALLETRSGRYTEVTVGQTVPGLGRIDAIERRGRQWVVITAKGFIAER